MVPRWLPGWWKVRCHPVGRAGPPSYRRDRPRIGSASGQFPAAMHMLDAAVQAVAALDEPLEATLSANIRRNVWRLSKLMIPTRGAPRPSGFFFGAGNLSGRGQSRRLRVRMADGSRSRGHFPLERVRPARTCVRGQTPEALEASLQWMSPTRWSATSTICSTVAATMGRTAA